MFEGFLRKHTDCLYFIFRVIVGLMIATHGASKFGLFGGKLVGAMGVFPAWLMIIAAASELVGGILIAIGLLTRLGAATNAIVMICAFAFVHKFKLMGPGNGELPLIYLAAFLVIFAFGARSYGIEKAMVGKEAI